MGAQSCTCDEKKDVGKDDVETQCARPTAYPSAQSKTEEEDEDKPESGGVNKKEEDKDIVRNSAGSNFTLAAPKPEDESDIPDDSM